MRIDVTRQLACTQSFFSRTAYIRNMANKNNYESEFYEWLLQSKSITDLKLRITNEMRKHGLPTWTYSRLDLSPKLIVDEQVGNFDPSFLNNYLSEGFYKIDMLLEHLMISDSPEPIFQSTVEKWIKTITIKTPRFDHYKKYFSMCKTYGYDDNFTIVMNSTLDGGKFLFGIASKDIDNKTFKNTIMKKQSVLRVIGSTLNRVGRLNFPDFFIQPYTRYKNITSSFPIKLLTEIVNNNLAEDEAAKHFHLSEDDVIKELLKLREMLNTKTDHGSYKKAKDYGYIK